MLISRTHRQVLLNLKDPAAVISAIPTAKPITLRGHPIVAVPHGVDEVKVLRNLGIEVPSPVDVYYEWPGRYDPFQVQRETASFLVHNPRSYCLNSMGTGKTMSVLWAYDYLRGNGRANRMLVVAPLSTLERTWADSIFYNFTHLNAAVLHGSRDKRLKLLADTQFDIYIVNHDGVEVIKDALAGRDDIDVFAIDESAVFRNGQTDRWKAINAVINKQDRASPYVWAMTGTPTPTEPTDAWAQARLVTPWTVPSYFGRFRDRVMRQVSQYKWVARDDAVDVVSRALQPSVRFTLDDCLDLPEQLFETRTVPMNPAQRKAYDEMLVNLRTLAGSGEIRAINEAVKLSKLVQIGCGVAYGANGQEVFVPSPERINELHSIVEQSEGKVLVFVPFTSALEYVAREMRSRWTVEIINGHVTKNERDMIFGAFQQAKDPHVLVAQPATMAHGLTLTAATTICWYAPITSNEIYEQANARARRPGQTRTTVVTHLCGSNIERGLYARLRNRQRMQGLLLRVLEGREDDDLTTE